MYGHMVNNACSLWSQHDKNPQVNVGPNWGIEHMMLTLPACKYTAAAIGEAMQTTKANLATLTKYSNIPFHPLSTYSSINYLWPHWHVRIPRNNVNYHQHFLSIFVLPPLPLKINKVGRFEWDVSGGTISCVPKQGRRSCCCSTNQNSWLQNHDKVC